MPHSAKAVANWFFSQRTKLTPMKLQKLVYFAHGWELGLKNRPLLDERIEAWPYGPVVPSLYHEFKKYGSGPITEPATAVESERGTMRIIIPIVPDDDDDVQALLRKIWDTYGHRSGSELSAMTHVPGSPWHAVWHQNPGVKGVDIPDDVIATWFSNLADRVSAARRSDQP